MLNEILYLWPGALDQFVQLRADAREARMRGLVAPNQQASRSTSQTPSIARINVTGPLMRYDSFDSWWMGATTYQSLARQIDQAKSDQSVKSVLFVFDSGGGTSSGCEQLASAIRDLGKPTTAFVSGMACSAAYWLASSCDQIIATPTSIIGSVGTMLTHTDVSKVLDRVGIKVTEIASSEWKTVGSPVRPLDEKSIAYLQSFLDSMNSHFVDAVITNRFDAILNSKSPKESKAEIVSAKVFLASEAQSLGLVDQVVQEHKFLNGQTSNFVLAIKGFDNSKKLFAAKALADMGLTMGEAKRMLETKAVIRSGTERELQHTAAKLSTAGIQLEIKEQK